jgi:hypothetical protein
MQKLACNWGMQQKGWHLSQQSAKPGTKHRHILPIKMLRGRSPAPCFPRCWPVYACMSPVVHLPCAHYPLHAQFPCCLLPTCRWNLHLPHLGFALVVHSFHGQVLKVTNGRKACNA